jgi:hypothetical protein
MAKSRQPRKKVSGSDADIAGTLQESLFQQKASKATPPDEPQPPVVGDKVTFSQSDTIYTISRVSPNGKQVDLRLEGTNIERFRVSVSDLDFIERRAPRQPPKPAKPAIDVEAVREHLTSAQHSSMDQLSGDIAILKKYLSSKGARTSAIDELDDLREATEKRWTAAVEEILNSLPD